MAKSKSAKKETELTLESVMWNCRVIMRGKASNEKQRDIILTLVFLKFLDEKFKKQREKVLAEIEKEGLPPTFAEKTQYYTKDGVFYIEKDCRWENILKFDSKKFALECDNIITKINSIDRLTDTLPAKIFTDSRIDGKVLIELAEEIDKIDELKFHEKDLIGRVYEYFLQAFSINATKEEGEFYTPHSIVETISALIEPYDGIIYDPCCGSGGMFVQATKFIEAHGGNKNKVQVYGQESNPDTYRLAKMNLAIRGISFDLGPMNKSTFEEDLHDNLSVDYIMANPPFNLKKYELKTDDKRWNGYQTPPASNANYAWILHMLSHLNKSKGVAGFLLANGALNDSDTLEIRKQLIKNDKVEAIIVLPREMFYTTDISVTLWILNNNKKGGMWHERQLRDRQNEILFVDLRTWNQNIYEKSFVQFLPEQIEEIADIYHNWQMTGCDGKNYEKSELYRSVGIKEIEENNFALTPSRYIEFVDRDSDIDYKAVLKESGTKVNELLERMQKNETALKEAFNALEAK